MRAPETDLVQYGNPRPSASLCNALIWRWSRARGRVPLKSRVAVASKARLGFGPSRGGPPGSSQTLTRSRLDNNGSQLHPEQILMFRRAGQASQASRTATTNIARTRRTPCLSLTTIPNCRRSCPGAFSRAISASVRATSAFATARLSSSTPVSSSLRTSPSQRSKKYRGMGADQRRGPAEVTAARSAVPPWRASEAQDGPFSPPVQGALLFRRGRGQRLRQAL
jgi:hypothetical protein